MTATVENPCRAQPRNRPAQYLGLALSLLSLCSPLAEAAAPPQKELIAQGVALHDSGDLEAAEAKFRQALAENPENAEALYELGVTLVKGAKWEECVEVAKRGQKLPSELAPSFVALAGSCLDMTGEPRKAVKMFRKGLNKYGDHGPLSFNLGVTLMKLQQADEARDAFQEALRFRSNHPSSNFYLGVTYDSLGLRPAAILAYLRFLTVEPGSQRSHAAANAVLKLIHQGVEEGSGQNVTLTIPSQTMGGNHSDLGPADILLSMASVGRFLDEDQGKSEAALSAEILPTLIGTLEDVPQNERKDEFLWDVLLPPLSDLKARELLEPLGYLAFSLLETPGAQEWVEANQPAVIELEGWMRRASQE